MGWWGVGVIYTHDPVSGLVLPRSARSGVGGVVRARQGFLHIGSRPWRGVQTPAGSGGGGDVTSITSLSQDAFGAAGGESIMATCVGVTGTPAVTINGVSATVTGTTGTTVAFTTPAISGITLPQYVTLVIGTQTFTNYNFQTSGVFGKFGHPTTFPLEVFADGGSVLGTTDFENNAVKSTDNQLDKFTTPNALSSLTVVDSSVVTPYRGSKCLRAVTGLTTDNTTTYGGSWPQTDICSSSGGTGRWHRWALQLPAATLASVANNGQIKLFLSRDGVQNFVVVATGPESRDPAQDGINVLAVNNDNSNAHINDNTPNPPSGAGSYGTEPVIVADTWMELLVYEYYDTVAGKGHAKCLLNRKKIADSEFENPSNDSFLAGMGDSTSSNSRNAQFGMVYTQNALSYPFTVYIDAVRVATSYIRASD